MKVNCEHPATNAAGELPKPKVEVLVARSCGPEGSLRNRSMSAPHPHSDLVPAYSNLHYDKSCDMFVRVATDRPPQSGSLRPLSVCIAPIAACNLRCSVCLSESGPGGLSGHWPELNSVLDWLKDWAPTRLIWTGGEPTLYPGLPQAIQRVARYSSNSVVCTNASTPDPCEELAGEFCYSVSVYGSNRTAFLDETGKDYFGRFHRNFERLFQQKHRVVASVRVDMSSIERSISHAAWLRTYPIRKLTILNTRLRGRLTPDRTPLNSTHLSLLRERLSELALPFPVVLPSATSGSESHGGLIVIERPRQGDGIVVLNGTACASLEQASLLVESALSANTTMFGAENYIGSA